MNNISKYKKIYQIIYLILFTIIIFFLIKETIYFNIKSIILCLFTIIFFKLPDFFEKRLKVFISPYLKILIIVFVFSSEVLGRVNNFYGQYSLFDNYVHTLNGFISASIGFSLIFHFIKNNKMLKKYPFFIPGLAFCFSMTNALAWEFFEYSSDQLFNTDMQQDQYIYELNTKLLDQNELEVVKMTNIKTIILYDKNYQKVTTIYGYIDIGLNDTMQDLFVNFIGAITYCTLGYFFIINDKKYTLAKLFLITKNN